MPVETLRVGRITDAKVNRLMSDWGGTCFSHISFGEKGNRDVVLVKGGFEPYILKKKAAVTDKASLDTERLGIPDYEAGILQLLTRHIDSAPVRVPTVIDEDPLSGIIVVNYVPGEILEDMQVAALNSSEKKALGTKLAQYVHWLAQSLPLNDPEFRSLLDRNDKPYDKRAALLDDVSITSGDLENVGQYTLATVREELILDYERLRRSGKITKRTIVGHNDLKPSNFVFNDDDNGDKVLTSIIDYEMTQPSTPEQEFRRTLQMGDDVMYAALEEYERLTGVVLDEEVIRFWDKVHFMQYASGSAMYGFPDDSGQILTRELRRVYPKHDWREVSGKITYPSNG